MNGDFKQSPAALIRAAFNLSNPNKKLKPKEQMLFRF